MFKRCLNVWKLCIYFILVCLTLSITLPYPFTSHPPHISQQLSIHILISFIFTSYVILLMLYHSLSFPSFLKFHRIVPLLQTCSTSKFVYDHACFLYMFIFWISSMYEGKHVAFLFLSLAYFT
jgi:hypothetical protein